MALTLAQAAALSNNQRRAGVMEVIATSSTVLDRLPFEDITGNAYEYDQEATLPGAEFRAVNAPYAESTGTTTKATEGLVILGGEADVDRFLQQTRSNLNDQMATQVRMKAKSVNAKFCDSFINGDVSVDANSFNGLKKRLSGTQVISAGTNGIPVVGNGGTDMQTFFDQLDALIALVPGVDALYTNLQVLAKISSAGRRLLSGSVGFTQDSLGRTISRYNNVPLLDIGNRADETQIIPQTETQGTSNVASSIYAVNFGEALGEVGVVGLTNGGVAVMPLGQLETKPAYRTRIEWYCSVALFGRKPAARLSGVLAA